MGLTNPHVRELLLARDQGAVFASTLTIGRQSLFLHAPELTSLSREFGLGDAALAAAREFGGYADAFLRAALNALDLQSLDASDYEGATLIHDLNTPLPFEQRFDAVIDGGSLEHIFNVPVALAGYMRALKPGGRLFIGTPANNLCGHGFYQFSPELMYRALGEDHGFRVRRMLLAEGRYPSVELTPARRCVTVVDPDDVRERVMLVSRRPAMLYVHAEKVRHLDEPFARDPQQSDYAARWREGRAGRRRDAVARRIPKRALGLRERVRYSLRNRRFYPKAG